MAFLIIDTYCSKDEAAAKVKAYEKAGRQNVKMIEVNGITVNDCSQMPCEAKFVQDGKPLYVVSAEG